jgi:hypothetical protein
MKFTIVKDDKMVIVDGVGIEGISMQSLPNKVRVVQWKGTKGHLEYDDSTNEKITDPSPFSAILNLWTQKKQEIDAKEADPYYGLSEADALEAARNDKLVLVDQEKSRVKGAGVSVDGTLYDSDSNAVLAYLKFQSKVERKSDYKADNWKASRKTFVRMDGVTVIKIQEAIDLLEDSIFSWSKNKYQEIKDASSLTTIKAISTRYTGGL